MFISCVNYFEEQAKLVPNRYALVSSERKYTYKTLNERANSVANSLISMGIEREERVLIYLPRVIDNYVANLGILKAGGAFVNASVSYPYDRIEDIFSQASCRFIITNKATMRDNAELFKQLNIIPLLIEHLMSNKQKSNPNLNIAENDLCYVIFTSGSTGKPKGAMIEHGNLSNFLEKSPENTESYLIYKNGTALFAMAQFTFDMSIMEEFLALSSGMTLVMAMDNEILDPLSINKLLSENDVDALIVTPAYLNMLIGIPSLKNVISNIKVMDFGAEAFPPALFNKIREINKDVVILNGYGPTEATISCTVKVLDSDKDITIGFPNGNVSAFIIDENLKEVKRGEEGELLICGKGVGRGYMNLPELTSKAFIDFNGMRGYRTGDYAAMRENGEIEYHGRRDSQVKLRGLRIELGEIEEVASSHAEVQHCAAMVYDNSLLVLYYSSQDKLSEDELTEYIKTKLAHYMIPDKIIRLDEMPMTNNLKIDRTALPKPDISEEKIVLPENDLEEKLLEMFVQIIPGMPRSTEASIVNAGISSLGFTGLIALIDDEFLVNISIADVINNPTVKKLEQFINNSKRRVVFKSMNRYPVSFSQLMTYECFKLSPTDMGWNLNYYYELPLDIDIDRLKKAICGAFVIHPELLSTFVEEDGKLWQIPADDELMFIPEVINISDDDWENKKQSLGKAFNLVGKELLFELFIYVTQSKVILYVDFAHIIIDGDSLDIFLRDVVLLYEKKQVEAEDMSAYQLMFEEETQQNTFYNDCKKYYEELYYDNTNMHSKIKRYNPDELTGVVMRPLKINMSDLAKYCNDNKITPNVAASGVFGYVLAKEEGVENSLHTVCYDNRYDSCLRNTVGYLCRNLPMYCHIDNEMNWPLYFNSVKEQLQRNLIYPATAEKYMHDTIPSYEENLVIFQSEMGDDFEIDGMTAKGNMIQHPYFESPFGIVLQLFPMGDTLMAVLVIDKRCYDEAYGNNFLDMMDEAFGQL